MLKKIWINLEVSTRNLLIIINLEARNIASFFYTIIIMKNIIELNAEIEKLIKPEVCFHNKHQTFSFFDVWVIEINESYFINWEDKIKEKINLIIDLDSPSKVKYLKVFHQDVLQKYDELIKIDYEDIETLNSTFYSIDYSPKHFKNPKKQCKDVSLKGINSYGEFNFTMIKMANIFYSTDWEEYSLELDPNMIQGHLEELMLEKLGKDEDQLEKIYSYTQLSWCLEATRNLLKNIAKHLDYLVGFIKKIENFEEDKLTLDKVFDNDPNNIKLEFRINKLNVALFFRVLHDVGIINVDNKNQKHPYTNLKKYLNSANIYYLENKKVEKLDRINKEFSKIKDNEFKKQEINLLEQLISHFKSRKEELESDKEEGLL